MLRVRIDLVYSFIIPHFLLFIIPDLHPSWKSPGPPLPHTGEDIQAEAVIDCHVAQKPGGPGAQPLALSSQQAL